MTVEKHPSKNFGELFWRPVLLYPDKIVIEQGEVSLTYAELEARTQQVAAALTRLGISRDDKVMLLMTNDYRFVETLFGIIRIGAVAVPVNIKLGNDNLIFIAEHSDSRILIAHEELLDKAQAVQNGAANIEHTLLVDGNIPGMLDYESSLAAERDGFTTAQVEDDDVAMMMYTSGSTGRPKGCLLSHASKWWTARLRSARNDECPVRSRSRRRAAIPCQRPLGQPDAYALCRRLRRHIAGLRRCAGHRGN